MNCDQVLNLRGPVPAANLVSMPLIKNSARAE
jgi:hypothetical protein